MVLTILRSLKRMDEAKEFVFEEVRDDTGAKLGMWLFILSELLLFGGMFILYSVYRYKNPVDFHHASRELDVILGTFNTLILLTSSLDHGSLHLCHSKRTTQIIDGLAHGHHVSWPPLSREQRH